MDAISFVPGLLLCINASIEQDNPLFSDGGYYGSECGNPGFYLYVLTVGAVAHYLL